MREPTLLDLRPRRGGTSPWWRPLLLTLLLGLPFGGATAWADDPEAERPDRSVPQHDGWSDEILDVAAEIPVQRGGRVKPLLTYARFALMQMTGYTVYRKNKDEDNERIIGPVEWALDCMFFPVIASQYRCILVRDWGALKDVGLGALTEGKKKSDRYAFSELSPAWNRIVERAQAYDQVDAMARTPMQAQVLLLWQNMREMSGLLGFAGFARARLPVGNDPWLRDLFPDEAGARESAVVRHREALLARATKPARGAGDKPTPAQAAVDSLLTRSQTGRLQYSVVLRVVPPLGQYQAQEAWYTPAGLLALDAVPDEMADILADIEHMMDVRGNTGPFLAAIESWRDHAKAGAELRDEWSTIPLEVTLYSFDPFFKALLAFLIGFVLVAFSWIWTRSRWLRRVAVALLVAGFLLTTYGITLRCIIRGNPPVTNLYETVLFVTAVSVLACLITERINKQGIALALTPIVGALGLFLAGRYEALEMKDTMGQLVAVLRSNFWLATHVTTIAIGYTAGLLAGMLGCFHVLALAFEFKPRTKDFYPTLTRMIYGMSAFCLLFSLVGTILGGIWANDSWGRFWGWDPKENGALMIVLWSLILLHGRMGGFLRPFGVAMCSVFTGCIVGFSWWGVNLLNIGLHTYGFTDGVYKALMIFFATQAAVLLTGFYWHFFVRGRTRSG